MLDLVWHLTQGQPWLVNALAYEVTFKINKLMEDYLPFLIPPLFFIIFPIFWMSIVFFIAFLGGWTRLAQVYATERAFPPKTFSFQGARLGWANYNGVLTIGVSEEGMYMKPFFLFRVGHRPLFIPWYDVQIGEKKGLFGETIYTFTRVKGVKLKLSSRLTKRLQEAAGPAWPDNLDGF